VNQLHDVEENEVRFAAVRQSTAQMLVRKSMLGLRIT
jgi:hypothetical protein